MAHSDTHLHYWQESSSKLFPFIHIFNELWKAGETTYIDLNTHAGEAWINIRSPLGKYTNLHSPKYPQYPSFTNTNNTPQPHNKTTRSPSYFRRLQSRKLARASNTKTVNESAAQSALKPTHNSTLTEKVSPKLNESAEKVSPHTSLTTKLTEKVIFQHPHTSTNQAEKLKPTLTEKVTSKKPILAYADVLKSCKTKNTPSTETRNKADKLKLKLDFSTLNTDATIKATSAHTTLNTDKSKMSPKPSTVIPTTSKINTPVPSHTPLQHNNNYTAHTLKTNAEKHIHSTETITPNTKITTSNTDGNWTKITTKTNAAKHKYTAKTSTPSTIITTPITCAEKHTTITPNTTASTHSTTVTTPNTYAEKHTTLTPNTTTTTPSTGTPKMPPTPLKPPQIVITPPPEDITHTNKTDIPYLHIDTTHIIYGGKKGTKPYYFV